MDYKHVAKELIQFNQDNLDGCTEYGKVDFHWRNTMSFIGEDAAREAFNAGEIKAKRSIGKTLGLALCYGGGPFTVKRAYPDKTEQECQQMVDNYFTAYKGLRKHLDDLIEEMHETGYIKTIFGRKIPVENWNVTGRDRESWRLRSKSENNASNYPIQGAGGEVIRVMVIENGKWIEKNNLYKMARNNAVRTYVSRIVTIDVNAKSEADIEAELDAQPTGNTLVLITDGETVLKEYDRCISFSPDKLPDYNIYF